MKKFVVFLLALLLFLPNNTFANDTTSLPINFTEEEQQFIKEHPEIRLSVDPDFIPYEFIDSDGQYKGIAADYIKLLSKRIGIEMIVTPNKTWPEAYELAVEKKSDVLACVAKTTERQEYFNFSNPYFTFQRVIIVQNNNTDIKKLEDLKYKTVAVQKNSSHHSYLKNISEINLSLYKSVDDALIAVNNGNETAFVGNLATSAYLIKSNGLTDLKYVSLGSNDQQALHFAVRNDWPILVSIINKGLSTITQEEKMSIHNKWIGLENKVDYSEIIKIAAIIGSIVVLIFIVSIYWILRLNKEIKKRIIIEEELRSAKIEAEIANRVKSSFLARMSHEIRTPLNAITGMAYLIKKSNITLSQKLYVEKITQASNSMLGIINDILDFSKIEAGKVEIENTSFNLDKVIQQVISIISFKVEEQGIGFSLSKEPKIPIYFIGDPKRIEQILLNLLSNAIKFTSNGEVSLGISLFDQEGELYHIEFKVKDTGIGMSDEQISQLFIPFSQADSSINRRFGGTGLGLSIVKSLVDMMDGEINVSSTLGTGSTFDMKLPLRIDSVQELEVKDKFASFYTENIRTLALSKNDSLSNLLDAYLVNFGIKSEFTKSPDNACELLKSHNDTTKKDYNLIIIDYDILENKSFNFAKTILENPEIILKPKIIMLLPMMREDLLEKIELYGLDLGISKPIIPSVLFDGIQEIFRKNVLEDKIPITISNEIQEKRALKHYNVLVVEDNKTNQFIAKSILEQVGISVILTDNGQEGAVYYEQHSSEIDLILMDLHMPILNGYDATLRIRSHDTNIPIVAMTADAVTGIEEQCKEVGINYYISKPFDPDNFIDTVLDILNKYDNHNNTELENGALIESSTEIENIPQTLPLINKEKALKLLGNNHELYLMVLKEFSKENVSTLDSLSLFIENKNYSEAAQVVHKIKGSSGNIGADQLYKTTVILQKSLENNQEDEIYNLYPEFNKLLKLSLDEIKTILKE